MLASLCCFGGSDDHTKTIERQLQKERKQLRKQVLYAGDIYNFSIPLYSLNGYICSYSFYWKLLGYNVHERQKIKYASMANLQNVISAMRVLLDARQKLGFPWQNPERQKHVEAVMRFTATDMMRGIDQSTFTEIAPLIRDLWDDQAIKHTYEQRNLFQIVSIYSNHLSSAAIKGTGDWSLGEGKGSFRFNIKSLFTAMTKYAHFQCDSCIYFFEHINRVSMPDYYPTNRDILFCRKATRGITEHVFEIQRIPFRFIDVGGQRSQRQKWFQCFEDITSILFMVASCEYDQVILEDRRTNRVVESRSIFETIANNKSFANVSIILFMNKSDLLEQKVPNSDIRQYFADFTGDHRSLRDVQFFLVDKFENCRRDKRRPFFYHFTTAVDTENIRRVFKDCRESILEQNLKTLMMQ
ncbi:unnamed protein product [Toxocara canis]|uniref:Guanine nucleotide-binding protein subunit alpha-12 n=1 Tax=Toxocara canis TaxID=6265 RepID=A0A183USZ9_TOXCA|nr:unnamed protein product [Toxocara canis]